MRPLLASKKRSSVCSTIAGDATILPVSVSKTTSRAGMRQPTKSRWWLSSSDIGKFVVQAAPGQRAIAATGNEQPIGGRVVKWCLGLVQVRNRVHLPACLQVDHLERVIVERGHKEALAFHIDTKMIHAPFDVR